MPARTRPWVGLTLAAPLLATVVTEDQTRVFAVLSTPVLLALVLATVVRAPERLARPLALAAGIAVLIPGFFVWKGAGHLADWGPWPALAR